MKKCDRCGKKIEVGVHPYANVFPGASSMQSYHPGASSMQSYHLQCLVEKIRAEDQEEGRI